MPRLQLPDRECTECQPAGNRFMKHVRTESEPKRARPSGAVERFDYIAFFRCLNCGTVRTELFHADNAERRCDWRPSRLALAITASRLDAEAWLPRLYLEAMPSHRWPRRAVCSGRDAENRPSAFIPNKDPLQEP